MKTEFFVIGPSPGTNIIKKQGAELWCLNKDHEWVNNPDLLRYFSGEACDPVTESEAKKHFQRITGGKRWN